MIFVSSIPSRSATSLANSGWLLPVSNLIELVAMAGESSSCSQHDDNDCSVCPPSRKVFRCHRGIIPTPHNQTSLRRYSVSHLRHTYLPVQSQQPYISLTSKRWQNRPSTTRSSSKTLRTIPKQPSTRTLAHAATSSKLPWKTSAMGKTLQCAPVAAS